MEIKAKEQRAKNPTSDLTFENIVEAAKNAENSGNLNYQKYSYN